MIFPRLIYLNKEGIYWFSVFVLIIGFSFDQVDLSLNSHGYYEWNYKERYYNFWITALAIFFLTSIVLIVIRVIVNLFFKKTPKRILFHVLFIALCSLITTNQNQLSLMAGHLQSIYFARSNAECRTRAERTNSVSICYRVLNDPNESAIVIDPNHETKADVRYLAWGAAYFLQSDFTTMFI